MVPMKYGDSPTESKPPTRFTEPQHSTLTGITMQYSRNKKNVIQLFKKKVCFIDNKRVH